MTITPDPVVSGVPYEVREVDGRPPTSPDDFLGSHVVVLAGRTGDHRVEAEGGRADGVVKLYEKSAVTSKDVRTWTVDAAGDGFTATSA